MDSRRALALGIAAALSLLVTAAFLAVWRLDTFYGNSPILRTVPHRFSGSGSFGSLPYAAQESISRVLGQRLPAYWTRPGAAGSVVTSSPHGAIDGNFARTGIRISTAGGALGLALSSYGRGSALQPVAPATPARSASDRARVT